MRCILLLLAPFLLIVALPAQSGLGVVLPRIAEKLDGSGQNAFPFSGSNQFSYQQIHDDLVGRPRVITSLAFRVNKSTSCSARTMNLSLLLSTAKVTSKTATGTFASNNGPDLATVISKGNIVWPAQVATAQVSPFAFNLPFYQKPFIFKGMGSFCIEVRVHTNTQVGYVMHDAVSPSASQVYAAPYGVGCRATGKAADASLQVTLAPGSSGYAYTCKVSNVAASQPAVWFIGKSCSAWGAIPLPLDLAALGAKGCSLYTAAILSLSGNTTSGGALSMKVTMPNDPLLAGMPLYSQCFVLDPGRAGLPLVSTNGFVNAFPLPTTNPFSSCRIYSRGSDTALSGSYSTSYPLVVRVGHL